MKYNNLRSFEKHLEEAAAVRFSSIYMVVAKDAFERQVAVDCALKHLLKGQKHPELCVKAFDDANLDLNTILDELYTSTLFAEKKAVVVRLDDTPTAALRNALDGRLEKIVPGTVLVLSMASINHSTNFYKNIEKSGIVLEIPESKPWEREKVLVEWVMTRLNPVGKSIKQDACQLLVKQVNGDMALLHNELEKLVNYVGERKEIHSSDVQAICTNVSVENVFQLGEAIFKRDTAAALRISKSLLKESSNLIGFLRQLRGQFQTEFQICSILATGGTGQDVAQKFPYMKGAILDRHLQMAQGYGLASFRKGMQQIDTVELSAKSSGTDPDLLAEMLMIKLTQR